VSAEYLPITYVHPTICTKSAKTPTSHQVHGFPPQSLLERKVVFGIHILLCLCIFIIFAKLFVLELQKCRDVLLGNFIKGLCPMEEASAFPILHWNNGVTRSRDLSVSIPICLGNVYHKTLKVDIANSILKHDSIQVLPKEDMCNNIFRLHITASNR
jgi:hypothetical protein